MKYSSHTKQPHLHLYTLTGIKICACMPSDFSVPGRVHVSAKFVGFVRITVGVLTFNTFFIQLYLQQFSTALEYLMEERNLTWHVAIKLIQENLSN